MKYDPKKKLFYYDIHSEEYKQTDHPALHTTIYQYDDNSEEFKIVDTNTVDTKVDEIYDKALSTFKKYAEKKEGKKMDNVNHPKHYTGCGIECIEAMQLMFTPQTVCGFCVCNAIKYLWRYKDKNGIEDIDKAWWYLNKATEINKNAGGTAFDNNMLFRVNKLYETVLARAERENNK